MKTAARERAAWTHTSVLICEGLRSTADARRTIDHVMIKNETKLKKRIKGNSTRRYPITGSAREWGEASAVANSTILRNQLYKNTDDDRDAREKKKKH